MSGWIYSTIDENALEELLAAQLIQIVGDTLDSQPPVEVCGQAEPRHNRLMRIAFTMLAEDRPDDDSEVADDHNDDSHDDQAASYELVLFLWGGVDHWSKLITEQFHHVCHISLGVPGQAGLVNLAKLLVGLGLIDPSAAEVSFRLDDLTDCYLYGQLNEAGDVVSIAPAEQHDVQLSSSESGNYPSLLDQL